ncbi:hypothetical protein [Clostridium tyrobutyricum]|uniref:hypothetical protein n=1 Tax=Clostridium tyrobutyricum TaxID=1519 RepID=UPI001C38B27D|nr:hypothetical protein [Clostridium tyrobutyricum]MBV4429510.1 hypothetical protein [Clostridium tyrobutyricum]MBV4444731.1 hypothetical protein [Clostridium tyrobutyricum]
MNKVQKTAYELIQADARFLYTLTDISKNAQNISSNYVCMSLPYIGLFTEGTEQWCKKVGLNAPCFNPTEKVFYTQLRQGHKLFEKSYEDYATLLFKKFTESENYFYNIRSLREKIFGYYNVGTDLYNGEFCGNTILCSMYTPIKLLSNEDVGPLIRDMSIVAGKLAAYLGCNEFPIYRYNDNIIVKYKDYHFYKNSPLKMNDDFGFLLFSILCSINYAIEFIENYFIDEIPQKFKYAYLQYYYLCDFIKEVNTQKNTDFYIDDCLFDRKFRNCLAHYGLGQYIRETEIISDDILKGLTNKAFGKDYLTTKAELYEILRSLTKQIKQIILE